MCGVWSQGRSPLHNSCSSQNVLLLLPALPRAPAVHGGDRGVHPSGPEDSQTQHGECSCLRISSSLERFSCHTFCDRQLLCCLSCTVVSKSAPQSENAACNCVLLHQCRTKKLSVGSSKASKQSHVLRDVSFGSSTSIAAPALSHLAHGSVFTPCMPSLQLKQFKIK